jgi:hypothetical protein
MLDRSGFVLVLLLIVSVGCGTSSSSSPPANDAGPADGVANPDAVGPPCTALDYVGPPVTPAAAAGGAPDATGGVIADGTYRLTAYTVYNTTVDPSNVPSLRGSLRVSAGSYEVEFLTTQGEDREVGTITTSGTTLVLAPRCPPLAPGNPRRYSVSGTRLDLYDVSTSGPTQPAEVATYTRE